MRQQTVKATSKRSITFYIDILLNNIVKQIYITIGGAYLWGNLQELRRVYSARIIFRPRKHCTISSNCYYRACFYGDSGVNCARLTVRQQEESG
jgi:hypothetical protein